MHAPHSGPPRDEREAWWVTTSKLLTEYVDEEPCFWMIDANAEPGHADDSLLQGHADHGEHHSLPGLPQAAQYVLAIDAGHSQW